MMGKDVLFKLESKCQRHPDETCFYIAGASSEDDVEYETVDYAQLADRSICLAMDMFDRGIERGSWCVSEMGNCAEFVYLMVAAAIGGFSVAVMNPDLSPEEKSLRYKDLTDRVGMTEVPLITRDLVSKSVCFESETTEDSQFVELLSKSAEAFDPESNALAVFSSKVAENPRAIVFTWANVLGAAEAVNITVSNRDEGLWQLAMPLHRVAGMQILFRSLMNGNPFILYPSFDARRTFRDSVTFDATHVSLWGSSFDEVLDICDEDEAMRQAFCGYECVFLCGSAPAARILWRTAKMGARVYSSFGMTETCGNIASCLVSSSYNGRVFSLPGYQLAIVSPDETGYGRLVVKGPGIVSAEWNPQLEFTEDGFLVTGRLAKIDEPGIRVQRNLDAIFVSKGEDVSPEDIRNRIMLVPGVTDAYVFSDNDGDSDKKPVAIVEAAVVSRETGSNLQMLASEVECILAEELAPLHRPQRIIVVPGFPRYDDGEVDTRQLDLLYSQRIDIAKVEAFSMRVPLSTPMHIGGMKTKEREYLIVKVTDWLGRTGIGECAVLSSTAGKSDSFEGASKLLRDELAPLVKGFVYIHPSQASVIIRNAEKVGTNPRAAAALENAIWDLNGKITKASLIRMIGARSSASEELSNDASERGWINCGTCVAFGSEREVLEKVRSAVKAGCKQVRLRIRPGKDISIIEAVHQEFPSLTLVLDAANSYTEQNVSALRELDASYIACLVDPLDPNKKPKVGPQGIWERLSRLQKDSGLQICVDRTWTSMDDLWKVLHDYPALRCVALRLSKMGGIQSALEFFWRAREHGMSMWMASDGGTSISARAQAAFCLLSGMNILGDFPEVLEGPADKACDPPLEFHAGRLKVNPPSDPYGLGCRLDETDNKVSLLWQV